MEFAFFGALTLLAHFFNLKGEIDINLSEYINQFIDDSNEQIENLFTEKIRLSKTYSDMHVKTNILNENEKKLIDLISTFRSEIYFLKTKQYRDDIILAKEKMDRITRIVLEISDLINNIEWRK